MPNLKLALIGNCQVQTYQTLLPLMLGDTLDLAVLDVSEPESRDEAVQLAFIERLADRDLVLTQRIDFAHINDDRLRARTSGQFVTIGNFYFRGLHPDNCYLGPFGNRIDLPSMVHSVVVLDAFLRGLSEAGAVRSFSAETFERLQLTHAWNSSLDEMERREAGGFIDVPCRDMMEAACRRYQAFHTMNHPSSILLADYMSRVLTHAGIAHDKVNAASLPDPLAQHDCFPVLDAVADQHLLPYRTAQRWRINHLGQSRFVGVEEFVAACYECYRNADPARVRVHSPTDLVRRFQTSDRLRFLVDAQDEPPLVGDENDDELVGGGVDPSQLRTVVRAAVREQTVPIHVLAEEIRKYMHKVHSFVETADPKIEMVAHIVPQLARRDQIPPPPDRRGRLRPPGVGRIKRWAGLGAALLAVIAAGAAVIGHG